MRRHNKGVKIVGLDQLVVNDQKQAEFEEALETTGHWARCPHCGTPKFVVPGFFDICLKCSSKGSITMQETGMK